MMNSMFQQELLQLPEQIHEALLTALEAERQFLHAERRHDDLRTRHYLAHCENGGGHWKAHHAAAAAPDVIQARAVRDQQENELKRLTAEHARLRDRLKVFLSIVAENDDRE